MKKLPLTFKDMLPINKALANQTRIEILHLLSEKPHNVNELAEKLSLPFSTTASHVNKLEEVDLIITELVPGRGTQKVSAINYDRIVIDLFNNEEQNGGYELTMNVDIGDFLDCYAVPHCGIVGEDAYIGAQDDPRAFFEPERKYAELIYFADGYIEYKLPNRIPYGHKAKEIHFSAELCSEAPNYKLDWPSDLTLAINDQETGTWTSPGDFGGERGSLTPDWWRTNLTQYGLLKQWKVNEEGSFIDNEKVSDVTIDDLHLSELPYIAFKIGIKDDAVNKGGMNLFGKKFGNYEQGIEVHIKYE
ncbi:ArsR/SmtB family transcription factor [Salisediminibacterium halotolerans]|uniref:ArsR/SmtB family transcription factor n=1 Tax=Salisediminibacterium halotolerans TaxID=517425 RepID=UPI000EAD9C0E|nr:ArsR family transcriptional regulator [Salisediminibacterium halotolerans]RLJ75654.1 putative transcriptional regulator [Actinophytocola xinjiangensis]RPE89508.1 putative transcriptional regulator [Salisediminibacterium halotolerans]TWG36267.1 putative transcriptional regulator [Salisediminibacterium halotolerans]GEL07387.1 transcriptional regulator [Salisediminibacterium halotolerans]